MRPLRFPWKGKKIPHGSLDLLRECNIRCKGCFNQQPGRMKSFEEVKKDLDGLMALRRVHTLSLTGGEVTLHPELPRIVQLIRSRKIKVAIVTNGLLIDSGMLTDLKKADLNLIMLHIQRDQERPDLPPRPTVEDAETLRNRKLQLIADHGMEAGISYIIFKNRLEELKRLIQTTLATEHTNFILLTVYRDFDQFVNLRGSLDSGYCGEHSSAAVAHEPSDDGIGMEALMKFLEKQNMRPFSFLGSNKNPKEVCWHAFLGATVHFKNRPVFCRFIKSSLLERIAIRLLMIFAGRAPFMYKPGKFRFQLQLVLNGLMGGDLKANARLLYEILKKGASLQNKHFLLQRPPKLLSNGEVSFCNNCPDATIKNGKLVPSCLSDRIVNKTTQKEGAGS